jgi:hypothetical protein
VPSEHIARRHEARLETKEGKGAEPSRAEQNHFASFGASEHHGGHECAFGRANSVFDRSIGISEGSIPSRTKLETTLEVEIHFL